MVSIFVGIWDFAPSVSAEQGPPNDSGLGMDALLGDNIWTTNGTWTIESGDSVTHSNKTIIVNGDLQINGSLTLINVTLQMANATEDGQYNITVFDAGNLLITDLDDDFTTSGDASVIESISAFRFGFQATPGAQMELKNSELYDCGWSTSPFVDGLGLFINSDRINITGNYITDSYRGVIIWESNNVTIVNNTIDSTGYMGIFTSDAEYCNIQYNTITNTPDYGIYLQSSIFLNVSYNTIIDNPLAYGISIDGGGGHDIYQNLIDNHDLGIFITADGSSYTTTYCYIFDNGITNNTRGIHIQGFDGVSAVQFMYIYDNRIYSNTEYGIFIFGDNGPFAVNTVYIFNNEIYDNVAQSGGHAIRFYASSFLGDVAFIYCYDNVIRDNSFSTSAGYQMRAASDVFIWDEQLLRNKRNIWIDSSQNIRVTNSTFEKSTLPGTVDVRIENKSGIASSVYFLNTTFWKTYTYVYDAGSFLNVRYFLHVRVVQASVGVDNANVWINDTLNNPEPSTGQPLSTGVGNDGWIRWIRVTDFNRTASGTTSFTPHHIDAQNGSAYGFADPQMDTSREVTINLDTNPLVIDISVLGANVLRTNQVNIVANGSDNEDSEDALIPHFEYKEPAGVTWETAYFGAPSYIGSAPSGYWEIPFIPPTTAPLGDYEFRVSFEDSSSYSSAWLTSAGTLLVQNNLPDVEDMYNTTFSSAPPGYMFRGETAWVFGDGNDIEDGDDQNLQAVFQYKRPGEPSFGTHTAYWAAPPEKSGGDWKQDFVPEASILTPLGVYNFRVRFQDLDLDWSTWENLENITVENAKPEFVDMNIGDSEMFRGESTWIFTNGTDSEELELDLTVEIYYDAPGGGTVWENTYLGSVQWDGAGFWKVQFTLPTNAPLGFYNFSVRFTDSDSDYNETIEYNLVNVVNGLPVPLDISPSSSTVSAGVGSIYINVNATDYEDSEDILSLDVEYRLNGTLIWETAYIGSQSYFGSVPSGWLRVIFQPDSGASLGLYDFRVRVIDSDGEVSDNPQWINIYNAVEVLSQIYTVDYIVIRDGANGGGSIVDTRTFGIADTVTIFAAGYNFTGNFVADVDVTWSSDDPLVGTVTPSGPSTTFTAQGVGQISTCNITATYIGGIDNKTGILTVLPPEIDYIQIMDAADGLGSPIGDRTYSVWEFDFYYAAAFNSSGGGIYLFDVDATWSSDDSLVGDIDDTIPPPLFTPQKVDVNSTCVVTATYLGFSDDTGTLTVLAPTIDYVQINDGPDGGGTNLCDPVNYPSFPIGYSTKFYGGYYNSTVGFIAPVPSSATWNSNDTNIVDTDPTGVFSTITCSQSNFGVVTITLDDGLGLLNTTQVTVLNVEIDYIKIRTQPNGLGIDISDPANYLSLPVGFITNLYAAAYNNTQGYINDITVTWLSDDTNVITLTSPGSLTTITVDDIESGTVTIIANNLAGPDNSTIITVNPPTVDYIQIRDAPLGGGTIVTNLTYPVGAEDTFYGTAYNHTAHYLGNVPFTSTWSSTNDSIVSVSSPSTYSLVTVSDMNYGNVIITLDIGGGITNTTEIWVLAPTIDSISIMDAPGGSGNWIGDMTYGITQTDTFYLVAFNDTAGFVADILGELWSSDQIDVGKISPTEDTSQVTFSAQIVDEDEVCQVNVTYGAFVNSTGKLTVLKPRPDYIEIRDEPGNSGNVISDLTFMVGEELSLYAAAHNRTTGYLGDVDAEFESSDPLVGALDNATGWVFTSQPVLDGGTCVITMTYLGISNSTGTITVLAPEIDFIIIRDSPSNDGNIITQIALNETERMDLYIAGYNLTSGYVKDLEEGVWDVTVGLGTISTMGSRYTFTAGSAGSGTITITYISVTNSTELVVYDIISPSKPSTPIKNKVGEKDVEFEWQANSETDVKEYQVQRAESLSGPWTDIATIPSDTTSYKDSGLDTGKEYYYRIVAIDESDNPSEPSEVIKIKTAEPSGIMDYFLWILIIIIIVVVVVILAVFLSKRGKGESQVMEEEIQFEEMQPIAAAPQPAKRPPPHRRRQIPPKQATPKAEPVEAPAPPPPPPPPVAESAQPEEASPPEPPEEPEEGEKEKKKKAPPPPPPPPPPE
jgi:parallel beta-helix repeat protein